MVRRGYQCSRGSVELSVLLLVTLIFLLLASIHLRLRLLAPQAVAEKTRYRLDVALVNSLEAQIARAAGLAIALGTEEEPVHQELKVLTGTGPAIAALTASVETASHALSRTRYIHFLRSARGFALPSWKRMSDLPEAECMLWDLTSQDTGTNAQSFRTCRELRSPVSRSSILPGNLRQATPLTLSSPDEGMLLVITGDVELRGGLEFAGATTDAALLGLGNVSVTRLGSSSLRLLSALLHSSRGSVRLESAPGFSTCEPGANRGGPSLRLESSNTVSLGALSIAGPLGCARARSGWYWPDMEVIGEE